MHGHGKLWHRLHYAKTAIGEKCPITRPLETLSPECAEGETDTDGYTLYHICTLQKIAKQSSAFDPCGKRCTTDTAKMAKHELHAKRGSLQGDKCLVLDLVEHYAGVSGVVQEPELLSLVGSIRLWLFGQLL